MKGETYILHLLLISSYNVLFCCFDCEWTKKSFFSQANVLVHRQHGQLLQNGIVIKTHSVCDGCYPKNYEENFNLPYNLDLCLNPSPGSFADKMHCGVSGQTGSLRSHHKRQRQLPCCSSSQSPYHKAIVLIRHPLDVVKSNFHFRLTSLGMKSEFNYDFVTDRISAWLQLYKRYIWYIMHKLTIIYNYRVCSGVCTQRFSIIHVHILHSIAGFLMISCLLLVRTTFYWYIMNCWRMIPHENFAE